MQVEHIRLTSSRVLQARSVVQLLLESTQRCFKAIIGFVTMSQPVLRSYNEVVAHAAVAALAHLTVGRAGQEDLVRAGALKPLLVGPGGCCSPRQRCKNLTTQRNEASKSASDMT